jgi:hypothetical protein
VQLEKTTIKKLEHLRSEAVATLQARRADILSCVAIDQKTAIIIDPEFKDRAKAIHEEMAILRQESAKFEGLIVEVKDVASTLGIGTFDFGGEKMKLNSIIVTNDQVIKRDVIAGVMSRERCTSLEGAMKEAEIKLKRLDEVTAPLVAKLAAIPDFQLPAQQRQGRVEPVSRVGEGERPDY